MLIMFRCLGWFFVLMLSAAVAASLVSPALAADPTTDVRVVKYAEDGVRVIDETTVTYTWMEGDLPVYGDGITHYYHQGPVFEGDMWDPDETQNLKDKGALKGTNIKDLCELVGGMSPGDELMLVSPDGYHIEFAYANVYEPLPRQGPIVLCWYKGKDPGGDYEWGYPGKDAFNSAMQIVIMAETTNSEGKFVFGNSDMRVCMPEEKYQHFYNGYPSTNGISGKWISEIRIYTGAARIDPELAPTHGSSPEPNESDGNSHWIPIILLVAGAFLVSVALYLWKRK